MAKFLDQTGLSHFWSKIKTLLAGKADTKYVDDACTGVYNMVSNEKADAGHTHDSFDGNVWVGGVLDADVGLYIGGEALHDIFAELNHSHSEYTSKTYVDGQISNTEGLVQSLDDRVTELEQGASGSSVSHKFKIAGRHSLTKNGYIDLSSYLALYDELMIIVRVESTASVTVGPSSTTSASSSGFLCSKALSGTTYAKIMVNKTDEGYMAWDIGGTLGWSNSTAYKYLRNYTTGTVTMSVVVHGR